MGSSFVNLKMHIVFAVKFREPLIRSEIQKGLYACVDTIVREQKGVLHAIGGMPDHVHLLVGWRTDGTIANLMREVKAKSSAWVRRHYPEQAGHFRWQKGYSVFSVSESVKDDVAAYIHDQENRHSRQSFDEELKLLLRKHGFSTSDAPNAN